MRARTFWTAVAAASTLVSRPLWAATWSAPGSGTWENPANWQSGILPSASLNYALFEDSIQSSTAVVTLTQPETAAFLGFETTAGGIYNLSGSTLTFDGGSGAAAILSVGNGNTAGDVISSPVFLNGNLTFSSGASATSAPVVFSGGISGPGQFVKAGTGPVTIASPDTDTAIAMLFGGQVTLTPAGSLASSTVDINSGSTLLVSAGNTVTVQKLGTLNLSGGSVAIANGPARTLVVIPSLISGAGSSLDLKANDLDVTGETVSAVTAQVAAGYNLIGGGNWTGTGGVTSSSAAGNMTHLTALAVVQNNQSGAPLFTSGSKFDGTVPGAGDVLVKYTYFGDANLDGKVDGSDYSLIDGGYAAHGALTGWYHGDFNYDGIIDGSDYALIDNASSNQSNPISSSAIDAAATSEVAAVPAAVPEPAGGFALSAAAILLRRRVRKNRSRSGDKADSR